MKTIFWFVMVLLLSVAGCGQNSTGENPAPSLPPVTDTYSVSGTITPALADITVQLLKGSNIVQEVVAKAKIGSYTFSSIANGTYTVRPISTAYTFSPTEYAITLNTNLMGRDFVATAIPPGLSISGRITQMNLPLPNIVVYLEGAAKISKPTLADGSFSFDGLASGSYTVTPQLPSTPTNIAKFDPAFIKLTNLATSTPNQNFTAVPVSTSGTPIIRNYNLYIKPGTLVINDNKGGATLTAWGYTDVADGQPKFPGPQLNANEGDTVNVTVVNKHSISHNLMIQGVSSAPAEIVAGATVTYSFTAVKAGSYLYYDTLNTNINREMGLYGALIVGPSDGSQHVWNVADAGPSYTFQRIWIVSEMDKPRWNDIAGAGVPVTTGVYKPNYFLINGQSGLNGMTNTATTIEGKVGETALVRIINAGQFTNSLHFHANHIKVLTVNGVRQTPIKELDVISIPPKGTADVLYDLIQPGYYPMHNHIAQMETSNGAYLNGIVTMINIK